MEWTQTFEHHCICGPEVTFTLVVNIVCAHCCFEKENKLKRDV